MLLFFNYALQSAVCLLLLYLPYHFIFKNTTFYEWNRFYLLGAILFALLAPLGDFQVQVSVSKDVQSLTTTFSESNIFPEKEREFLDKPLDESAPVILPEQSVSEKPNIKTDITNTESVWSVTKAIKWLSFTYFAGVALFALLYFLRLLKLFLLIKKGKHYQHQSFTEVQLSAESKQVFSFFGFVFLNRAQFTEYELATVLKHEQVHIQHWHSVDILLMEILQIVFWFNPFYRLYNNSLQNENEYFADQLVAGKQNTSSYAETLLQLAVSKRPVTGQAFAYIPVKHRIFKLFQSPSLAMEKSKYLATLPLLTLLFICFSCSFEELDETTVSDFTGEKVRIVKAYYTDQQAVAQSKMEIGKIAFDENGTIEDMETISLSEEANHPYLSYFLNSSFNYEEYPAALNPDFYTQQIPWLLVHDPLIKDLQVFIFRNYPDELSAYEADLLVGENDYEIHPVTETKQNARTRIFSSDRNWEPITFSEIDFGTDTILLGKGRYEKFSFYSSSQHFLQVAYNEDARLDSLNFLSASTFITIASGEIIKPVKTGLNMKFVYNENEQVSEVSLHKGSGEFIRKYQFAYNEVGYCTQKALINREGSVEFTVDFEYEYYPAD